MTNAEIFRMGVDVGSTTAKVVIVNAAGDMVYTEYRRHNAETVETLQAILKEAREKLGDVIIEPLLTGSAGMGITEKFKLPFVQEVVASAEVIHQRYPSVKTLIDIGGEDAKMIFFDDEGMPDIRMNGSCAGGTGAFIDEMASLLNVPVSDLDGLSVRHTAIHPMASRCGVFAKTDLQNLLSRQISKEDIAASVFHAVVLQTLATLSRGRDVAPSVMFSGGPLTFLPSLKNTFLKVMNVSHEQVVNFENAELLCALGAALTSNVARTSYPIDDLINKLGAVTEQFHSLEHRLPVLFNDVSFDDWSATRMTQKFPPVEVQAGGEYFLGIDSGSTTTKVVLIDENGSVAFKFYSNNRGNAIETVQTGLKEVRAKFAEFGDNPPKIARGAVTGYGEDLMRAAFGIDEGIVETLAHFRAAQAFEKDVSFIMDIGGQDMKAIFVKDGHIQSIEINEACSSGCGSFIESFAKNMGYNAPEFAKLACDAEAPCDLGTRCTVFMNSKVKQALREGAQVNDISAGLAYSVIKNALHKVLKITDVSSLGEHIVVQGGSFRNPAIQKALEQLLGRKVTCPDIPELMGAYGAALTARDAWKHLPIESRFVGLERAADIAEYNRKEIRCHGCENKCAVIKMTFPNKNIFFTGNRCEKIYSNGGRKGRKGVNLPALKYDLLFERETEPTVKPVMTIGIPRVLNLYENYPFWNALFLESGIRVKLSSPSSNAIVQDGAPYVMSENLCFPAKLASGHVVDLIRSGVDRIFYPMVFYEEKEFKDASNTFHCPIVSGYPDVIRSSMNPEKNYDVPFDMPPITFSDAGLLKKACVEYLTSIGISKSTAQAAFEKAQQAQRDFKNQVRELAAEILEEANEEKHPVIVLMGRPYHLDQMINHKLPDIIAEFGVDVITEDSLPREEEAMLDTRAVVTQWAYVNRYYYTARWVGQRENTEMVMMNSFGCGPDSFIIEEVRTLLAEFHKSPTIIRIDEIESPGSTKLRIRSMMESMTRSKKEKKPRVPRKTTKTYQKEDRHRTILIPDFSPFCSPAIVRPFVEMGFNVEQLPPTNRESVNIGLKYSNNEICYPGTIVSGDVVKALNSGKYDLSKVAIAFSQTGGQCRATSYAGMIKKAMVSAGFAEVPVVTISTGIVHNEQPGFEFNAAEYKYKTVLGIMFTDALSEMYHSTVVREKNKGESIALVNKYTEAFMDRSIPLTKKGLLNAVASAVEDFNAVEVYDGEYPKVGVVGEIYVKYNAFSNNHVVDWMVEQGIEVVMPSFLEFFAGCTLGAAYGVKGNLQRIDADWLTSWLSKKLIQNYIGQFDRVMSGFARHRPHHDIHLVAERAGEVVSLNHQYGEAWLLAGEVATLSHDGVDNVLCMQPFGCVSNHIIAKGIQKRLKEMYPKLNILFLDADAGVSEVNYFNRMHFFISHAKAAYEKRALRVLA